MPDWPQITLLLTALCGTAVLGLSPPPAGCRGDRGYGAEVIHAIGEVWTEPGCLRGECQAGPDGAGVTALTACRGPPYPDCEVAARDLSAEYPACCARYRCPGRCFSDYQRRWFAAGETWTEEGCMKALCYETDEVIRSACGLLAALEPGCRAVPGNSSAEFPGCCYREECSGPEPEQERPCYVSELRRHFAVGESWALAGCSGRATCGPGGSVVAVGCPLEVSTTPGCSLDGGDPNSLQFPQCCPKITCAACHSQRNDRFYGPGDTWTGHSCTTNVCLGGPLGASVAHQSCGLLGGPLPFPDCEVAGEDPARGDYPRCCTFHRCPGRCRAQGRWFSVGEQWDDGCTRALCIGTDHVERLTCPLLRVDPSRPDCHLAVGDTSATYPACCPTVQCSDASPTECRDAEAGRREVGAVWTAPGCVRSQCTAAEGGVAVISRTSCPPPPYPDCTPLPGQNSEAAFPGCCPTFRCPARCFSRQKARWFAVGDEWTEDGCTHSVCVGTAQVRQAPCPFVSARRAGCSVVAGDASADYPGCCRQVRCEPSSYQG